MTPLRQRMLDGMGLRGLPARMQEVYVRAVRQLAERYGRSPDPIEEEDIAPCPACNRAGALRCSPRVATTLTQGVSMCSPRHRHIEWLKFLRVIDREVPKHLAIHLIADNYATHKHAKVKRWLERHSRFRMHFTPTSASWLNMVERFFRDITTKRIRRGAFPSVRHLVEAIEAYIKEHNQGPKSFIWTAKATDILAKVARAWTALRDNSPSA